MPIITASAHSLSFNGTYTIPMGYHDGNGYVTQNIPSIEDQVVISPAFEDQTISVAGNYMVQDILVNGIDALNYQRPSTEYLVNDEEFSAGDGIKEKEYKLSVDNWHDNATLNVYYFELGCTSDNELVGDDGTSSGYNIGTVHGVLFIDWKNTQSTSYTYLFEESLDTGIPQSCTVSLYLEADTNAHTFKFSVPNLQSDYHITYFRVRELFHARQFGDDHDTDDTTSEITP